MTVREVIMEINRAMEYLQSINIPPIPRGVNLQERVNKAYDILYDLKHDLRSGK